jgi:hypothetical protein
MRPLAPLFVMAILGACVAPDAREAHADGAVSRRAIVVELFSSEGCSSCPPADAVLRSLTRSQAVHDGGSPGKPGSAPKPPVAGAEVIGLELHVDYWNYLGWTDPFSSAAFTARQRAYASAFHQRGVYTPQAVVDGAAELVGSHEAAAKQAIAAAARAPKADVRLALRHDRLSIMVTAMPEGAEDADVWLAITEDELVTAVPRGENAGTSIAHGPVARAMRRIGAIPAAARAAGFSGSEPLALDPAWRRENLRAVALVQHAKSLRIVGAGALSLR